MKNPYEVGDKLVTNKTSYEIISVYDDFIKYIMNLDGKLINGRCHWEKLNPHNMMKHLKGKKMKTHWFTHVCKKNNLTDKELSSLFEAGCGDATFTTRNGKLYASFARKRKTLEEAIRSSMQEIQSVLKRVKIEDTIIEQEKGDCGIVLSIGCKVAYAKLQEYASHIDATDKRFRLTSHIVLEDGSVYVTKSSFLIKINTTEGKWLGVISEHQMPQIYSLDEVVAYDHYCSENIDFI